MSQLLASAAIAGALAIGAVYVATNPQSSAGLVANTPPTPAGRAQAGLEDRGLLDKAMVFSIYANDYFARNSGVSGKVSWSVIAADAVLPATLASATVSADWAARRTGDVVAICLPGLSSGSINDIQRVLTAAAVSSSPC